MRATVLPQILPETEELLVFYRQRLESEIDALALDCVYTSVSCRQTAWSDA